VYVYTHSNIHLDMLYISRSFISLHCLLNCMCLHMHIESMFCNPPPYSFYLIKHHHYPHYHHHYYHNYHFHHYYNNHYHHYHHRHHNYHHYYHHHHINHNHHYHQAILSTMAELCVGPIKTGQ
jgi:hypothetical protein